MALAYLLAQGMVLCARNYHTAGRGGGELDLVMCIPETNNTEATLVFVEIRSRKRAYWGSAAESITATKRRRIVLAAQAYLLHTDDGNKREPACRFDVVLVDAGALQWLPAAFDASSF